MPQIPEATTINEDDYKARIDQLAAIANAQQEQLNFLMRGGKESDKNGANVSPNKRNRESYEDSIGSEIVPLPALVTTGESLGLDDVSLSIDVTLSEEGPSVATPVPGTSAGVDMGEGDLGNLMSDLLEEDEMHEKMKEKEQQQQQQQQQQPVRVPTPPAEPLARVNKKRRGSLIPQIRGGAKGDENMAPPEAAAPVSAANNGNAQHRRLSVSSMNNNSNINTSDNDKGENLTSRSGTNGKGNVGASLEKYVNNGLRALNERIRCGKENGNSHSAALRSKMESDSRAPAAVAPASSVEDGELWRDL